MEFISVRNRILDRFLSQGTFTFWLLVAFLSLIFLAGGSGRNDVQSLAILRPVSILICGIAIWNMNKHDAISYARMLTVMAMFLATMAIYLLPLPAMIWASLPGRSVTVQIDHASSLRDAVRPMAVVGQGSWDSITSAFVPFGILLLGIQLNRDQLFKLLTVLLVLGLLSALIGLIQVFDDPKGPLYLYRITNNGLAVGLFANRNHQAILLVMLLPMLAVYGSMDRGQRFKPMYRTLIAFVCAATLIPLILITGSRAGLVIGLMVLPFAFWLYARNRVRDNQDSLAFFRRTGLAVLTVAVMIILSVAMSRDEALQRLIDTTASSDSRAGFVKPVFDIIVSYLPFGAGPGAFADIYKMFESDLLLDPTYLNHAHNDWLEFIVSFGFASLCIVISILIFGSIIAARLYRERQQTGRQASFGLLAFLLLAIMAISSFFDYPLRTPIMAAIAATSLLWLFVLPKTDASNRQHVKTPS